MEHLLSVLWSHLQFYLVHCQPLEEFQQSFSQLTNKPIRNLQGPLSLSPSLSSFPFSFSFSFLSLLFLKLNNNNHCVVDAGSVGGQTSFTRDDSEQFNVSSIGVTLRDLEEVDNVSGMYSCDYYHFIAYS